MSETKILVVDDEPGIVGNVRGVPEREGYVGGRPRPGRTFGLALGAQLQPGPRGLGHHAAGIDGSKVLRRLRKIPTCNILFLTRARRRWIR